jgi:translation initiation factor 1
MTMPSKPPGPPATTLGDLLREKGVVVGEVPAESPAPPASGDPPLDFGGSAKIVLRREKKRRGGRTATIVEGLMLPPSALERIARELRRALGCGAHVDHNAIVVQGDVATRLAPWLTARGAKRVVVGN